MQVKDGEMTCNVTVPQEDPALMLDRMMHLLNTTPRFIGTLMGQPVSVRIDTRKIIVGHGANAAEWPADHPLLKGTKLGEAASSAPLTARSQEKE
jgi:hypothetical protein